MAMASGIPKTISKAQLALPLRGYSHPKSKLKGEGPERKILEGDSIQDTSSVDAAERLRLADYLH
jgi:hypothetical protein